VLSDGAFVLLPPLAMQIFKAKGRNPLAGLVAGLACVSVGYSSGLIFGTSDVGYTAVTESAAKPVPGVHSDALATGVTMNWFITSTIRDRAAARAGLGDRAHRTSDQIDVHGGRGCSGG
jgi:aminobenzoyl-glutamate transport protein